jgi:hypothetical protein
MTKLLQACSLATLAIALAGPAAAQVVGTYTGTQANGQGISITVGTDTNTNSLAITNVGLGFTGTCRPGGSTFNTGWGLGGTQDFTGNTVDYLYSFGYFYTTGKFTFHNSSNTVTGYITSVTPTFAPVNSGAPTKSVFCVAGRQTFTATLGTSAKVTPPSTAPVLLKR